MINVPLPASCAVVSTASIKPTDIPLSATSPLMENSYFLDATNAQRARPNLDVSPDLRQPHNRFANLAQHQRLQQELNFPARMDRLNNFFAEIQTATPDIVLSEQSLVQKDDGDNICHANEIRILPQQAQPRRDTIQIVRFNGRNFKMVNAYNPLLYYAIGLACDEQGHIHTLELLEDCSTKAKTHVSVRIPQDVRLKLGKMHQELTSSGRSDDLKFLKRFGNSDCCFVSSKDEGMKLLHDACLLDFPYSLRLNAIKIGGEYHWVVMLQNDKPLSFHKFTVAHYVPRCIDDGGFGPAYSASYTDNTREYFEAPVPFIMDSDTWESQYTCVVFNPEGIYVVSQKLEFSETVIKDDHSGFYISTTIYIDPDWQPSPRTLQIFRAHFYDIKLLPKNYYLTHNVPKPGTKKILDNRILWGQRTLSSVKRRQAVQEAIRQNEKLD